MRSTLVAALCCSMLACEVGIPPEPEFDVDEELRSTRAGLVVDTHPSTATNPDPSVPPPLAAMSTTAVGSASGSAGVSLSGNSTYSIAIPLVAGRGGMQPSLQLAYDNGNQSSAVGVGWSLRGVVSVRRQPTAEPALRRRSRWQPSTEEVPQRCGHLG